MREIPIGTILWKKCYVTGPDSRDYSKAIVELEVTKPGICATYEDSYGISNSSQKCRVRAAKVLRIYHLDTGEGLGIAYSMHNPYFIYKVGEIVAPTEPFDEHDIACGSGIHGFESVEQAENYTD